MERLWAPWRVEYIRNPGTGCFFCKGLKAKDNKKAFIVEKSAKAFTIMNRFPYNNGHLMIASVRHIGLIENLDDDEILEMNRMLTRAIKAINYTMKPQGYNIGLNQGRVAGAGERPVVGPAGIVGHGAPGLAVGVGDVDLLIDLFRRVAKGHVGLALIPANRVAPVLDGLDRRGVDPVRAIRQSGTVRAG